MSRITRILNGLISLGLILASTLAVPAISAQAGTVSPQLAAARQKIKHIIIILQENRSFDEYFGTYPGAVGIPMKNGVPTVCLPDPYLHQCDKPYYNPMDENIGGPHTADSEFGDVNFGQMNGFVAKYRIAGRPCGPTTGLPCPINGIPDVVGWHDARQIPNYWKYAQNFVLEDHLFAPSQGGSLPEHLYLVSEWSAKCSVATNASTCTSAQDTKVGGITTAASDYPWTDLTYLLHKHGISWAYYLSAGLQPDCPSGQMTCTPQAMAVNTPGIWNPLPAFDTVKQDGQVGNVQPTANFFTAARSGTLPAVSWVIPNEAVSEHPPALISDGQAYVTSLVNAVMQGPDWNSSAIFLAWDDWGGFYDNVPPVRIDANGYGIRVPGIMISPWAQRGRIDHQTLSFDAYTKFIEDIFLGSQRINPATDGRPDPRPDVREKVAQLGDVVWDFNFTQTPLKPLPLPLLPPPGPPSIP